VIIKYSHHNTPHHNPTQPNPTHNHRTALYTEKQQKKSPHPPRVGATHPGAPRYRKKKKKSNFKPDFLTLTLF